MKYQCGHDGCDICGGRECAGRKLERVGDFIVCEGCKRTAIKFAYDAACKFGGITIDVSKPCGDRQ